MKCRTVFKLLGASLAGLFLLLNSVRAQSSAFTYQGLLRDSNGVAVTGSYQLQFKLRPAASTTNQVGPTLTNGPVGVSNGLFTVTLDFGAGPFDGTARWLEVGVRTNGATNAFDILNPTQPFSSAPYALRAAVASSFLGVIADGQLSANIPRFDTGGAFTGPVVLSNGSGVFSGTLNGTFSGSSSGTFSGNGSGIFTGNFTGTNSGTFIGNGGAITNINVTNIVGVVQSNPNWQIVQSNPQQAVVANNYLSTNDAQTSIILPNNPGVGSAFRVAGSGAGGWILSQNSGQSVYTGNLGLPAGRAWTARATGLGNLAWRGIASSANGLKLVAAQNVGSLYTSADGGFTWTARATGFGNLAWQSTTSSADGSRMAAVVFIGNIYTSSDSGSNWTRRATNFGNQSWVGIASSADGIKLAAAANIGNIYTSTDGGTNWTQRAASLGNLAWGSIASSADGTKLAAAVSVGNIFTSIDSGSNWTSHTIGAGSQAWSGITSSSDGTKLAAVINNGLIYTSGDSGQTWTPRTLTNQSWFSVSSAADGNNLVAVVNTGLAYTSFDSGQTWVSRTVGNQSWFGCTMSGDGTRAAATVNVGNIYTSLSATTVGVTGFLSGSQFSSVELQYVGGGLWMPLSATGSFSGQ